jgi:hypothetical protein
VPDNQTQSTVDWYVEWLAKRRPDLSEEVRLEIATGFASQQALPLPKAAEVEEEEDPVEEDKRAELRKRARLTAKELTDIIGKDVL